MNLSKLFLISVIFSFLIPYFSFLSFAAITPGTIPSASDLGIKQESPVRDVPGLLGLLKGVVQVAYTVFFIVAVLFILFAAYNYLTAQGKPENINIAHKQLLYAGIAIVVALLAIGVSTIIKNFLENPTAGGSGYDSYTQVENQRSKLGPLLSPSNNPPSPSRPIDENIPLH